MTSTIDLSGKVAIVTGGNSGIGLAIVLALAQSGAKVIIDYVCDPQATFDLEKQVAALAKESAIGIQADVSTIAGIESLINAAIANFGRLDIMCNNAGIETRKSLLETTEEQYEKVLQVNLKSAFFGSQLAAKQFINQNDGKGGVIINTSSVHEDWPMPGNIVYCLSKGGMRMLTRTAGLELAAHKIRFVNVCPGAVDTPINEREMNPATQAKLNAYIPLGRMAQPSEIANVVAFLASDQASYMTTSSVIVDGGMMHQSPGL